MLILFVSFLLVRHPPTLAKLRKEIVIECESNLVLSREKLGRMRFLNNVIKESGYITSIRNQINYSRLYLALRLYPSVPFNFRTATRDTILPHGGGRDEKSPIFVPQGTTVAFFPYALHRRLDIYGLDAEQFRPERWDQDPSLRGFKYASPSFVSFGNGLRTCLGSKYLQTSLCS